MPAQIQQSGLQSLKSGQKGQILQNTSDSSKTFHLGHLKMTLAKESRRRALLNKKVRCLHCPCRAQNLDYSADRWSTSHNICSLLSFQCLERLFKSIPNSKNGCFCSQNPPPKDHAFLHAIYIHTINFQCCFPSILSPASCLRWSNSERACIKRVLVSSYLVSAKPSSLYHF